MELSLSTCSPLSLSSVLFFWDLDFGVSKSSFEYDHEINKGIIKVSAKQIV